MRRICLTVVGLYIGLLTALGQTTRPDSTQYQKRKLKVEEINLVSSYYHQEGNHAAVTGGIGSQKLTDYSNNLEIKLNKYDRYDRKHTFDFEIGVDHYTSASSDKIDPKTISSASSADTRLYPSLNWTMENEKKGTTIGAGVSYSHEFDYQSTGANINFAKKTADRNGEFSVKLQAYLDNVKLVYPIELRTTTGSGSTGREHDHYDISARNSFSSSFSYSQIINQRLQIMFLLDLIYQKGYLGLPFYRVYFDDNSVHVENLPDNRFKVPIGFRVSYFLGDRVILRGYYRYYKDNWGLGAHTVGLETSVKITSFFSVSPFYRFYTQSAMDYFAPYGVHTVADKYYSSNYDLSKFNSHFLGAGIRLAPPTGILGWNKLNMLEIRYGHYVRTNDLQSNIITLNLKWK